MRRATKEEAFHSHRWSSGLELPICLDCGLSPISTHTWGDGEWCKAPIVCGHEWVGKSSKEEIYGVLRSFDQTPEVANG